MSLLKKVFYAIFFLAIVKQALGERILAQLSRALGLQDSFTRPILQNIDLFFVFGCAIIFYSFVNRAFFGGKR
jgi:hypothetical protein